MCVSKLVTGVILNQIDTRTIYLAMKIFAWYIDPNGIHNKNIVKHPYPTSIKICENLITGT